METDLLVREYCKRLRLPTLAANFRRFAEDAARENRPYERYLLALLEREIQQRTSNQEQRRIKAARFPVLYTLDTFDFDALPGLSKVRILELAQGHWLPQRENVILVGDIGTGKTHLAIALAMAACRQGKRVRFFTAAGLVNELLEAQDEARLSRLQTSLLRQDLVVLDELGFIPFNARGAQLLFQFCSEPGTPWVLRGSLLITTNLTFDHWGELVGDPLLGGALVDRLTHRCHVLEFRGQSFRFRQSLARQHSVPVEVEAPAEQSAQEKGAAS